MLAVLILAITGFVSVTTELMPSGLLTQIAPDLGTSVGPAGSVTAAYAIGIVVTVLPLTRLTLRMPRRAVLVATLLAFVASNVIVALASSLPVALIGRFIGGASHGLLWAVMPPVIARITGPAKAGRAMAVVFAGNSLGLAVGAPLSTVLGGSLGWRWAFLIIAVAGLAIAALMIIAVPAVAASTIPLMRLREAAQLPGVMRVSVGWALMLLGHFAVFTYIDPYLERTGFGTEITGVALFVLGIAGIVGVVLGGRTPRRALMAGLVCAPALMAVAFVMLVVAPLNLPLLIVVLVLWGGGFAAAVLYNQESVLVAGRAAADTATSISVLVIQFGIALGAIAGGLTLDIFGVGFIPLTGLVFVLLSVILLLGMRRVLATARVD